VWTAISSEGGMYVALFNAGDSDGEIKLPLDELEISGPVPATELWSGQTGDFTESITAAIPSHGAMAFYIHE